MTPRTRSRSPSRGRRSPATSTTTTSSAASSTGRSSTWKFLRTNRRTNRRTLAALFNSLGLDFVMLREVDQVLDLLARGDELGLAHTGVVAGLAQLGERALEEVERGAQHHLRLDTRDISHLLQLLPREERPPVAVAAALHVDQRQAADPRRALGLRGVAREEQSQVGTGVGRAVDAHAGFIEPEGAAGVGARDDNEIGIAFVALLAGVFDLVDVLVYRNAVHHILMVVGALRVELVFDVRAGNPGADAFAHRAHGVQRVAEAGAAVDDERDVDALRDVSRELELLGHRQQRLGHRARGAADVAADIRSLVAQRLDQAPPEGVIDRRVVQGRLLTQHGLQPRALAFHRD